MVPVIFVKHELKGLKYKGINLDPPTDVRDIINWHLISINQYLINIRFAIKKFHR
jgi:hypothetical protein